MIKKINERQWKNIWKLQREDNIEEVAMIELNISRPNVKDGGMAFDKSGAGRAVTREVRKITKTFDCKVFKCYGYCRHVKIVEEN